MLRLKLESAVSWVAHRATFTLAYDRSTMFH